MGVQWEELVGKFLVHSLYFLVIENSLPTTSSQARLSYQTCIKLSSRDVSLNHTGTLLKVFSKNYKRTSKTSARIRTAKKKKTTQGSQVLLLLASLIAKPNPVNYKIAFTWDWDDCPSYKGTGTLTYC